MLRERGTIRADEISVQTMKDKGLDPQAGRKTRTDFNRRIPASLHDLMKANVIEKVGRGVTWQLKGDDGEPVQ